MKKSFIIITLIISALALITVSCRHDKEEETQQVNTWSPEPGPEGTLPTSVLPEALQDDVLQYFTANTGNNPHTFEGMFVSHPHVLIHSTMENDTVQVYNDRYIAFFANGADMLDFYGKQWDDHNSEYYQEAFRRLNVIGTGDAFSCYYLTEGYPNGMYAKQATIFSGEWNESYGGLKDFQVAVILLETSGNPNLAPVNSFRVLGDGDGLAQDTMWMGSKRSSVEEITVSHDDAFSMFRVR